MKLLVFDTETTSLKPGQICQLSYITIDSSTKPQKTTGHNFSLCRVTEKQGQDAHTDRKYGLTPGAATQLLKLFMVFQPKNFMNFLMENTLKILLKNF